MSSQETDLVIRGVDTVSLADDRIRVVHGGPISHVPELVQPELL
jgi:hypothetical protein